MQLGLVNDKQLTEEHLMDRWQDWVGVFVTSLVSWVMWDLRQAKVAQANHKLAVDQNLARLNKKMALAEQEAHNEKSNRSTADLQMARALSKLTDQHESITTTLTDIQVSIATLANK